MAKAIFSDYKPGEPRICNWTSSVHFGSRPKPTSSEPQTTESEPSKDPPAKPEVEPPSKPSNSNWKADYDEFVAESRRDFKQRVAAVIIGTLAAWAAAITITALFWGSYHAWTVFLVPAYFAFIYCLYGGGDDGIPRSSAERWGGR
jgi:hypothetical protein